MPSSSRPSLDAGAGDDDDPRRSFSDAADDELSAALSQRIGQIASASSSYDTSSLSEEEMRVPMNGKASPGAFAGGDGAEGEGRVPEVVYTRVGWGG